MRRPHAAALQQVDHVVLPITGGVASKVVTMAAASDVPLHARSVRGGAAARSDAQYINLAARCSACSVASRGRPACARDCGVAVDAIEGALAYVGAKMKSCANGALAKPAAAIPPGSPLLAN